MRFFRALAIAAMVLAASISSVAAHAELTSSTPAANSVLQRAPAQVVLDFTETLEPAFSSVQVLNAEGVEVSTGEVMVDGARMTVSLRSLREGVYTVVWKALSRVDGHLTTGSFPFAVGNVQTEALGAAQAARATNFSISEVLIKWILLLTAAALAGGELFRLQVWPSNNLVGLSFPWKRWFGWLLVLWLCANVLSLALQAGKASGAEWVWPWSNAVGVLLMGTRFGSIWLARLLISVVLIGLILQRRADHRRWLVFGLMLAALLTISLGSHAATEAEPFWPVFADWIHLLAASVWVGGLMCFVLGLWHIRALDSASRIKLIGELIPRFSRLALLSVGALTLSGVYSAMLRVGSWEGLFNTAYGLTLVVKLAIALVMMLIGAVNMLIIPRLLPKGGAGQFQRNVTSEVYLSLLLMLSVAVLTNLPPARAAESGPRAFSSQVETDGLQLDLEVTPARVGLNEFVLTVLENGQPVNDAREVQLDFTPLSGKVPSSQVTLAGQGGGRYRFAGSNLSLPEAWQLQVAVRRDDRFDVYANFNLNLGASAWLPEPRLLNAGLIFVLAVIFGALVALHERSLSRFAALGGLPSLGLFFAATLTFASSAEIAGPVNPFPPNAESVARGRMVYTENCAMCHGVEGRGDGPVGLTLNPRPADLTIHAVPGVHTDGRLFEWISKGVPGSLMPAFEEALSEEDRWHLINFMRQVFGR